MPKKSTARRHSSRGRVASRNSELGLSVAPPRVKRSASTECGLDTRSHRTPSITCGRVK